MHNILNHPVSMVVDTMTDRAFMIAMNELWGGEDFFVKLKQDGRDTHVDIACAVSVKLPRSLAKHYDSRQSMTVKQIFRRHANGCTASKVVEVEGQPCTVRQAIQITASGDNSTSLSHEVSVDARIPVLGPAVAWFVKQFTLSSLKQEVKHLRERLEAAPEAVQMGIAPA